MLVQCISRFKNNIIYPSKTYFYQTALVLGLAIAQPDISKPVLLSYATANPTYETTHKKNDKPYNCIQMSFR